MITTGIIKEINISSSNYKNNKYLVELNLFQIPGDYNKDNYTYEANCCVPGGLSSCYQKGDKVFVTFLHDDLSYPIILGKIYQGLSERPDSYAYLDRLKVNSEAQLSKNTSIGDITYEKLSDTIKKIQPLRDGEIVIGAASGQSASSGKKILSSDDEYEINDDTIPTTKTAYMFFKAVPGFDQEKSQTLKNINGVLTWVDD